LANPNNPTGTLTSKNDLLALLQTGVPLVVDEAYYEFTGESAVPLMNDWPNLMVLRTFSKWSGLAGLRVGYGLFPRQIADYLHAIRDPYNVNAAALVAVRESFQDLDYLMGNVGKIVAERERFAAEIGKIKRLRSYPSRSNFILCDVLEGNAAELQQRLESQGILVRYYSEPRLRNCLRFSVGKPEQDDILIEALKQFGR
jgi:histidinol-phosphate aminotransferase